MGQDTIKERLILGAIDAVRPWVNDKEIRTKIARESHISPTAQFSLGLICMSNGQFADSAELFTRAISKLKPESVGDDHLSIMRSAHNLAILHEYGIGVPQNRKNAIGLNRLVAELGEPVGFYNAGRLYAEDGDHKSALDFLEKAMGIKAGPFAGEPQRLAAVIFLAGSGEIAKDLKRARELLAEGIALGNRGCEQVLAEMVASKPPSGNRARAALLDQLPNKPDSHRGHRLH